MSRLIIKNLPNTVTSEKLRERFATKGVITDLQLKYTPHGKFRHFGFIGYQNEEQAISALQFFNNTFIGSSKITVEQCAELGGESKPKAWSKYAKDSSAYQALHPSKDAETTVKSLEKVSKKKKNKGQIDPEVLEKLKKHKDDPMFVEFMEANAKESKNVWDNDTLAVQDQDSGVEDSKHSTDDEEIEKEENDIQEKSIAHAEISDMEYLKLKTKKVSTKEDLQETKPAQVKVKEKKKLYTVKVRDLPYKVKKRDLKEIFRPLTPATIRIPPKVKGIAYIGFKTEKEMKKALIKNKTFLSGKQLCVVEYTNKEVSDHQGPSKEERWKEQEEALKNEESIIESGCIFVRNLAYTVTEDELRELFSNYGPITEVHMPVDKLTRKMKGFATVTYLLPENAVSAYTALDGSVLHGRMLHLLPAKTKDTSQGEEEGLNYKSKKLKKQKAEAGYAYNWNTLFVDKNAVAEVIADNYNTTKEEVLTGKDVAVRLALGETQIVSETKQFLLSNGVNLNMFNQAPKQRSKTVILVKNLPAKTTAVEIRDLFAKFGELGRVLLPPSGITAIVEFLEPSEARTAFVKLAYSKFKYLPLYIEWAPEDTFSVGLNNDKSKQNNAANNDDVKEENEGIKEEQSEENGNVKEENEDGDDTEATPEPDTTLFIKNLNFDTNEDGLKKHFSKCGRIANVTVARKKDPKRLREMLSMGYGFIQFFTQAQVKQALKNFQNSSLDGHNIELKRSNRTLPTVVDTRKKNNVDKQTGSKIMVRNIPFQATHKEVLQLFKTFGEIKSLRLPKKMVGTGPHRGFAFVEYNTKQDAKRAMQALCQSTHFFGRRLVLEWAKADDSVEEIRKRTAQDFKKDSHPKSKKSRADLEIAEDSDS